MIKDSRQMLILKQLDYVVGYWLLRLETVLGISPHQGRVSHDKVIASSHCHHYSRAASLVIL